MESLKVDKVVRSEKGNDLHAISGFKFSFQNILGENMERWCCSNNKCKCYMYIKRDERREVFGGNVTNNHDKDSNASLNGQILNNSVKRKAMEDLCERPRKLIHKDLQSQDLNILTCKDIQSIRRNIHKARSSQLPPLPTNIEETHEALSAVQVLTSFKEQFCLLMTGKKDCNVFLQN
jgi:hypothetical protein